MLADNLQTLLVSMREHRYLRDHINRAIRELAEQPAIRAKTIAEHALKNISSGRRGVTVTLNTLVALASEMARKRWDRY